VRAWLVLAALAGGLARGAAPAYSADSIVNGANFAPGPFAPNSVVTVFGSNLAFGSAGLPPNQSAAAALPEQLSDARVYVDNMPAPLIYVSPTQINLLLPSNLKPGSFPLRVVRQGVTGPEVTVVLAGAAPQFFVLNGNYAIAQHGKDYSFVTPDSPAAPGEIIVIYATGLGATSPNPNPGEIPKYAGAITSSLQLSLGGTPLSADHVFYAGLTPGSPGVYQINLLVPQGVSGDVEIRAVSGAQTSAPGVKLATQLSSGGAR